MGGWGSMHVHSHMRNVHAHNEPPVRARLHSRTQCCPPPNLRTTAGSGLRKAVNDRVLGEILCSVSQGNWKVLVLDDLTTR